MECRRSQQLLTMNGVHHISIACSDLEKSKVFYGEVFQLTEIERPPFDFDGAWYDLGGNQQLHLIVKEDSDFIRASDEIFTRDSHIAVSVQGDYNKIVQHLAEKNIPFHENKTTKSGFIQIFCIDPDRHIFELNIQQ